MVAFFFFIVYNKSEPQNIEGGKRGKLFSSVPQLLRPPADGAKKKNPEASDQSEAAETGNGRGFSSAT